MILATDMGVHAVNLEKFKRRLLARDFDVRGKDKIICLESILHLSDISYPLKNFSIS